MSTLSTTTSSKQLGSQRFAKFSSWKTLTRAIARLRHIACLFSTTLMQNSSCKGWHYCKAKLDVEEFNQASAIIIRAVQEEVYNQEIKCIQKHERIPKRSPLKNLDPFIDMHGLLRPWAVIFTCMSIRAVHIEVIESLDISSFINALRRFIAVRGPVKHIRSDCGTNFVGACKDLRIPSSMLPILTEHGKG